MSPRRRGDGRAARRAGTRAQGRTPPGSQGPARAPGLEWKTTDRILREDRLFTPSEEHVKDANISEYMRRKGFRTAKALYDWSRKHPEEFWADLAGELEWSRPWKKVLEWKYPHARWFLGARCNIVHNALDRHMGTWRRNKVALYWEGEDGASRTLSYSDLHREVNLFANALRRLGIRKGDRVSLYLPRIPEQVIAMLAVARIGAVHSVVYSGFSAQALRERIQDAEAKVVITADGYQYHGKLVPLKAIVDEAISGCPSVKKTLVVRRLGNDIRMVRRRDLYWEEAISLADPSEPCEEMDSEDMLFILYTSGTTGKPKGVVHVHGGYMVGTYATQRFVLDIRDDDIYWCTADPGWITGHSYIVYAPLICGATSVLYEGAMDFPDPGRAFAMLERHGVSILYTTPTAIRALMRHGDEWPERHSFPRLRLLGTVGEPINPEAWVWYRKIAGDRQPIMDTWWQTETGMQLITPLPITPLKPGSATLPFPGIEADVVDKNGRPVPAGKGGYLVIKRPWPAMMRTIYKDPARYESYWNTIKGVYVAGDACHKDKDGYFWIQGRVDDVIKKSGYRLGSMEIESALVSHPAVAEAAVIGKPDPLKGEAIKAFVVLRAGHEPSDYLSDQLRQHVRETVGPIAIPDEIQFESLLPRTRSGKIMRRLLKATELGQPAGDISTLEE